MGFFGRPFSGCLVTLSATLTGVNYTSATAIPWDSETYDYGTWHDPGTNPSRLTVPAGVLRVALQANIVLASVATTDTVSVIMTKNGGLFVGRGAVSLVSGVTAPSFHASSAVVEVVAGDYFECTVQVSADTSININSNSSFCITAI